MEGDSSPAAIHEGVEEVDETFENDGAILEIKVEYVAQENQSAVVGNPIEKPDEPVPALRFAGHLAAPEVGVCDEPDLAVEYLDEIGHAVDRISAARPFD
jgi:hypothetical protein